ncbi:MAG: hypothetical protein QG611_956, partial [Bacteroidota bacterium]|nr:hypothetical protein [Bacteroidota bacterium]
KNGAKAKATSRNPLICGGLRLFSCRKIMYTLNNIKYVLHKSLVCAIIIRSIN